MLVGTEHVSYISTLRFFYWHILLIVFGGGTGEDIKVGPGMVYKNEPRISLFLGSQ